MKRSLLALTLLVAPVAIVLAPLAPAHAQEDKADKPKKPKSKPQEVLAAKGAFPTVGFGDPKVKSALFASDLIKAKKMIGKTVNVMGKVEKVYIPKSNSVVLLNFAKDYKSALVGAVVSKDYAKFPPLKSLSGKKVLLTGKLIMFKGAPQVELNKTGAIAIVK